MSGHKMQVLASEKLHGEQIEAAEKEDNEFFPVVPGSRLHEAIHNPVDGGIEEG